MSKKYFVFLILLTYLLFVINFVLAEYSTTLEIFDSEQDEETQIQSNNEKVLAGEWVTFYANYSSDDGLDLSEAIFRNTTKLGTTYMVRAIDLYGTGNKTGFVISEADDIYVFYGNGTQKWKVTNSNFDYAYGMEIYDFNNDSFEEIAFISSNGRLFVLNGTSGSTIFETASYTSGTDLASGDLDEDGRKDDFVIGVGAITGDASFALMAFIFNETSGTFNNIWNQTAPTQATAEIDISEISGDRTLVTSTGGSGGVLFYFYGNNGTQKWATGDLGTNYAVTFFDQDSDGKEDEVAAGTAGDLEIYTESGTANGIKSESWAAEYEVTKIDLDGDGIYDDLLVSSQYNGLFAFNSDFSLAWEFYYPHKEFESLYYYTTSYIMYPLNVRVGNVNNDSLDEIIVAGYGSKYYILNTSGNIIGKHYYGFESDNTNADYIGNTVSRSPGIDILNDTNGDGIPEIAVTRQTGFYSIHQQVMCKINITGHYREEYMYYNYTSKLWEYYYPLDYRIMDGVQNDNIINWTVKCEKGGYETQELTKNLTAYTKNTSLEIFDEEDDNENKAGWLAETLVIQNQNTYFFANYTDLEINAPVTDITTKPKWHDDPNPGVGFYDLIAADFNGDGRKNSFVYVALDSLIAYSSEGTFIWQVSHPDWDYFYDLTSADFNNDTYDEIAGITNTGLLVIVDKDGNKLFQSTDYGNGYSITKGDLDDDNVKDIVMGVSDVDGGQRTNYGITAFSWNASTSSFSQIWKANDSTASPVEIKVAEIQDAPNRVACVDYNGAEKAYVYYGNGTFIYSTAAFSTSANSLKFFDYYEDGTADDLIIGDNGNIRMYNSTGSSIRTDATAVGYVLEIETIDYDGDGFENEYVYFERYYIRLEDKAGTQMWYYDVKEDYYGSLEVRDINNDGEKEIIFAGGTTGTIYIFNKTGSLLVKFSAIFPDIMSGEELGALNNNYFGANTGIDFTDGFNGEKYLGFTAENSNVGAFEIYPECIIYFSDGLTKRMYYNASAGLYYYNRTFSSSGDSNWNITCKSINHLNQTSSSKTISIIPFLDVNSTSPENSSYFNNEFVETYSVLLNATIYDLNLNNLTVWFYGNSDLINTTYNQTNGTFVTYNWTGLNLGQHNWSVVVNDGTTNSSPEYSYFNIINLTINCEAGGPYQEGALVLVQGNLSDGSSGISSQSINASVYLNSVLNTSNSLTSTSDGSFQTTFSGLAIGNYTLNTSTTYQGISVYCLDNFSINAGYSAGFIAGNESGYILGFDAGNITGFNLGNISGFILGNASGFELGNATGFVEGYSLGNTTGFILGNETGYILGNATGFTLGDISGFILGNESGFILGNLSGFEIGNATGFILGNVSGYILGNISGFYFGNQTGYETGYSAGFIAGNNGSASLILDKIASFHNITNETISYNITLRFTNKGKGNATLTNITDSDSDLSPYDIGTIEAGVSTAVNYIKSFIRNSTTYNYTLSTAEALGVNSYSGGLISANSSQITLNVPSSDTGQQLTLVKNAYFNSENSTTLNYTVSIEIVNSGGVDLSSITLIDSDLEVNALINLNRTQLEDYSGSIIIPKAASNTEKLFVKSTATVNSVTYESNQINFVVPGYGGPADAIVYAPASVETSTSFDTIITVENQNPDIGQDFTIDYWITNEEENTNYTSGQQTIYVAAMGTSNLRATLNSPSTAGNYKYKAIVSWVGGTATAYDTFEATSTSASETSSESSSSSSTAGWSKSITGQTIIRPENLMDVLVKILEDYRVVNPGNKILAEITFLNLGTEEIKDAVFTYCINNNEGTGGNCVKETVAVHTKIQLVRSIVLPSDIEEGTYSFYVKVNYMNETVESGDSFEVRIGEIPEDSHFKITSINMGLLILILFLLILIITYLLIIHHKKKNRIKNKKQTNVKKTLLGLLILIILSAGGFYLFKNFNFESLIIHGKTVSLFVKEKIFSSAILLFLLIFITGGILVWFIASKSSKLFSFKKDKKNKNYLSYVLGLDVFSANGEKIGKVKEIYLEKNKISQWLIQLNKKLLKKIKKKNILIKHKHIKSVGDVVIICGEISDYLKGE